MQVNIIIKYLVNIEVFISFKVINFHNVINDDGNIVIIDKDLPFEVKRVFYIFGTKENTVRGKHANICSRFLLVNLSGKCKILVDDLKNKDLIELDKANVGLFLDRMVWKEMFDFSEDSILLVLSDYNYDESEYIKSYDEYVKHKNKLLVE